MLPMWMPCWPGWRRDFLVQAVLIALTVATGFFGYVAGHGLTGGAGEAGGTAVSTPPFGTLEQAPLAPSPLALADPAAAGKKPAKDEPRKDPVDPPPPRKAPPAKPVTAATAWRDPAHQSLADRPVATAVEKVPRPVEAMAPAEIAGVLRSYQHWLHQGQIRLLLDFGDLTPEQMAPAVAYYLLSSGSQRLRVGHRGEVERLEELPPGKLVGDLPRGRWPAALHDAGVTWFGPGHTAHANLLLSDACQVRVYRLLARALEGQAAPPGTEFVMHLKPSRAADAIDLELVKRKGHGSAGN